MLSSSSSSSSSSLFPLPSTFTSLTFAVIGDFGMDNEDENAVSKLVHSWKPDAIIAVGDVNYPSGDPNNLDNRVAKYYHDFLLPPQNKRKPEFSGRYAVENAFFPCPGNHDWEPGSLDGYLSYFSAYSSPVHFPPSSGSSYHVRLSSFVDLFSLDSGRTEVDAQPDAHSSLAAWFYEQLDERSTDDTWKIAISHFPPYSSGKRGSTKRMQWEAGKHGLHVHISGHDHHYERFAIPNSNVTYFVNGLGGCDLHNIVNIVPGSVIRYNSKHGAQRVFANSSHLIATFINVDGEIIDEHIITKPSSASTSSSLSSSSLYLSSSSSSLSSASASRIQLYAEEDEDEDEVENQDGEEDEDEDAAVLKKSREKGEARRRGKGNKKFREQGQTGKNIEDDGGKRNCYDEKQFFSCVASDVLLFVPLIAIIFFGVMIIAYCFKRRLTTAEQTEFRHEVLLDNYITSES